VSPRFYGKNTEINPQKFFEEPLYINGNNFPGNFGNFLPLETFRELNNRGNKERGPLGPHTEECFPNCKSCVKNSPDGEKENFPPKFLGNPGKNP